MNKDAAFELIKSSKRVLLHLHPKPDPDSIGSALAMYHALRGMGKEATVIQGDSPLPEVFSFLPGYEAIVRKSYFDTDLSEFDLFIIQDSGSKQIISRKGEVVFPLSLKTLTIDHHKTNEMFSDVNLVDPGYAATAEFLFDLFNEWRIVITPDIAACLYVGIYSDTGGFKYSSTKPRTLNIVAALAQMYPNFTQLIADMENNNTKGFIYFEALAVNSIETYLDDSLALAALSYDEMSKRGITREDSDRSNIASAFLSVKEWKIAAILIEKSPGEIKVSLRSKDDRYDMGKVAYQLGGGGHVRAAGITLMMPLEEAKRKVVDALKAAC